MRAAHTEGLLAVSEQATNILKRIDAFGPTRELIGYTMGDNADANARRIAACWNALEDMSTKSIESISLAQSTVNDVVRQAMRERGDLAAARALLEQVLTVPVDMGGLGDRIQDFLKGGAA